MDNNQTSTAAATTTQAENNLISTIIDGLPVSYSIELTDMTEEELAAYVRHGRNHYGQKLAGMEIRASEGEPGYLDLYYDVKPMPFQRLRRITGYLVGDLSRWNDGKRAEEHDRVKHA